MICKSTIICISGTGSRIATTPAQLQNGAHEQQHDAAATIHSLNQSRDGEGADVGEDVEWEVAASSRNALRRRRRKVCGFNCDNVLTHNTLCKRLVCTRHCDMLSGKLLWAVSKATDVRRKIRIL